MKLSEHSINAIRTIISGDDPLTQYKSGPKLVEFFNSFGARDVYKWKDGGLPNNASRNQYVIDKLTEFNGTKALSSLLLTFADERFYSEVENPDIDSAVGKINGIIKHDNYKLDNSSGTYVIVGEELPDEIEVEVHFEEIQQQILDALDQAKYTIWVTVAWFTNKPLFDKLIEKKNQGINVQVIVLDDEINRKWGFNYEEHFETKRFKKMGMYENIMHNKFCIIDLKTVIHGSYNWTNKANYNKETISIETSRELAERYATEFMKLKK
ncbi:phospholipase D-like domain-containing protein [Tenacibaculum halocynthiae]|uniref:phospholipase D-like domain-containing protein n=1 Tax=Tenacibaculum halocynthiae TaxID=1254437 RepID=UPI0038933E40